MASWNVNLGAGGFGRLAKIVMIKELAAEGVDLLALQEVWPGALIGLTGEDGFAHTFMRPSPSGEPPKASAILASTRLSPVGTAHTLPAKSVPRVHCANRRTPPFPARRCPRVPERGRGSPTRPSLVMKGSPVRVRASALGRFAGTSSVAATLTAALRVRNGYIF
jgi:hypothetical protein